MYRHPQLRQHYILRSEIVIEHFVATTEWVNQVSDPSTREDDFLNSVLVVSESVDALVPNQIVKKTLG